MENKRIRYIYEIRNLVNDKTYIGQHLVEKDKLIESDTYMGSGVALSLAKKKYGISNFEKQILISGYFSQEEINRFERCAIFMQRLNGKAEYNIADGGFVLSGNESPTFGKHWYTNGTKNIISDRCPEGFWKGFTRPEDFSERVKEGWAKKPKELRQSRKGRVSAFKGKHHSAETKEKIRQTKLNSNMPDLHWYTNGIKDLMAESCPDGFYPGRSSEEKKRWYTDGKQNIFSINCPDGFYPGRGGNKPSNKGLCWYTDGTKNIMASSCPSGFRKGMTKIIK